MAKRIVFFLIVLLALSSGMYAQVPVFINEIHYDDAATDTLEGVEIAGPVGTNLSCFVLYLYNGSNPAAAVPYDSIFLSGILGDQCNGYGTAFFPTPGIQNGSNDGIALVFNPALPGCGLVGPPTVIQFLSYEGTLTGAASTFLAGQTSTDIGVSENSSTLEGQSMQLTGNGSFYGDFTWTNNTANTYNGVNTGQTFGGPCGSGPAVATEIRFTFTPAGCITPGQNFNISVCGTDATGNVDLSYAGNIILSLISGPGSLTGTTTQTAVLGCTNFTNLSLTSVGAYQIRATDGTFSDTSAFIYISPTCATCPNLNAALIDACGVEEGRNEILFYSSGDYAIPVTPAAINITYGASTPPATGYTNSMVSNQPYIDSLNTLAGCGNLFVDALSNSPIPPNTEFLVMNYQPLTIYDFSAWCTLGPIYIVFSDDADWNQFTGNFKNRLDCLPGESGLNPRYFRSDFTGITGGSACDFTHSYIPCNDLLNLGNGDGLDFGYGGGTPTAAWNECTPSNVLSVEYGLGLQAMRVGDAVRLDWQTTLEINSNRFDILRSTDPNGQFESIGSVPSNGNSNSSHDYRWYDMKAPSGSIWYRLDEYDANGNVSSSNLAAVHADLVQSKLEIAIANGYANFELIDFEGKFDLMLFDLQGRQILTKLNQNRSSMIQISDFPTGVYIYQLKAENQSFQGKISFQK